jgi:hypothetical protein
LAWVARNAPQPTALGVSLLGVLPQEAAQTEKHNAWRVRNKKHSTTATHLFLSKVKKHQFEGWSAPSLRFMVLYQKGKGIATFLSTLEAGWHLQVVEDRECKFCFFALHSQERHE